jgi:hypothetical protein
MSLFEIRRDVGDITREDLDAASLRAIVCAYEFPNVRWIRSFWDRKNHTVVCYYEADSAETLWEHSRRSLIPCDDVTEVEEFGPGDFSHIAAARPPAQQAVVAS